MYKSDSNEGNKKGTVEGNKNGPSCVRMMMMRDDDDVVM